MKNIFDVADKNVIVTGGNRGNGFAIAQGLVSAGARVIRVDKEFSSELNSDDYKFDLTETSEVKNLVHEIASKYKSVDALVNNAGVSIVSNFPYDDMESYRKTLDVNLHANFILSSNVCKLMANNEGGSIVNITSLGAEFGFKNNPSYQISKAGLKQLTKALAMDWGAKGIRVNNICPGYIRTAMTEKSFIDSKLNEARKQRTILGRWGVPDELVGPVIFLISDASSYITGSDIYVDGGWSSKGM